VDEALALRIEVDAPGIGVLLELVADREVAELRGVPLPSHGVAARPVADRLRADVERHADRVAGVEARAAHLGELPAGPQVARAPFGVRLEASRREGHRPALNFDGLPRLFHDHAVDAVIVRDQRNRARLVPDVDAVLSRRLRERVDEPGTAAHGLDGEPAPEPEAAFHLERLPPPGGGEAHALAAHP